MKIRLARQSDIESLIQMRLDFTMEYNPNLKMTNSLYTEYYSEIKDFLIEAIASNKWFIWLVEIEGLIVSHIFLELIHKVPRPGKKTNPFVYMTNVYTLPSYRGKGIGSKLLDYIKEWSIINKYEFIIVWPSDNSIDFYKKNEYKHCIEPMELMFE